MDASPVAIFTCGSILLGTIFLTRRWRLQGHGYANASRLSRLVVALAVGVWTFRVGGPEPTSPCAVRRLVSGNGPDEDAQNLVPGNGAAKDPTDELIFRTRVFGYRARRKLSDMKKIQEEQEQEKKKEFEVRRLVIADPRIFMGDIVDTENDLVKSNMTVPDIQTHLEKNKFDCTRQQPITVSIGGQVEAANLATIKRYMHAEKIMTASRRRFKQATTPVAAPWKKYFGLDIYDYQTAVYASENSGEMFITWEDGIETQVASLEELHKKITKHCKRAATFEWFNPIMNRWEQVGQQQLKNEKEVVPLNAQAMEKWFKVDQKLYDYVKAHADLVETAKHSPAATVQELKRKNAENAGNDWFKTCPLNSDFLMEVDDEGLFLMCPEMKRNEETR